jgi:transcriptional regulator with XRE-family HTH domain
MKERIGFLLDKYSLSSAQFADLIGVQRSSISHILSGRNKPSFDFIHKILLKYPEIDANWLLTGKGDTHSLNTLVNSPKSPFDSSDLFNQQPNIEFNTSKNTLKTDKVKDVISEKNDVNIQDIVKEVTNVNKVKSIVIIYQDNSFEVLNSK